MPEPPKHADGLLARIVLVPRDDLLQRSREDLARRRLLLDQARHRWLLQARRGGSGGRARAHGSLLERARERAQRTGPPPSLEPGFRWGMPRVGEGEQPLGAVPICHHHRWEVQTGGTGLHCLICGLTTSKVT